MAVPWRLSISLIDHVPRDDADEKTREQVQENNDELHKDAHDCPDNHRGVRVGQQTEVARVVMIKGRDEGPDDSDEEERQADHGGRQ